MKANPLTLIHAISFAAEVHAGQTRRDGVDPYIVHPIRVAEAAADADLGEPSIVAAVLHDVLEDGKPSDRRRNEAFIQMSWPDAYPIVVALTKDSMISKDDYYKGILNNSAALHLKLLDRADNLNDMYRMLRATPRIDTNKGTLRWAQSYLKKTHDEIQRLLRPTAASRFVIDSYDTALARIENLIGGADLHV